MSLGTEDETSFRIFPVLAMFVGLAIVGLGVLLLSESPLGGGHIAAIGLSLFLSGAVATGWAARRWELSPARQHKLSLAFSVLAGVLLVAFIVINWATFEGSEIEEGTAVLVGTVRLLRQ
jgi:hypothetical protein